jgi:serine/threonine protein kinase
MGCSVSRVGDAVASPVDALKPAPAFVAVGADSACAPSPTLPPPRYRLGRTLGSGGFSVVRLATRTADGAKFAAKVIPLPPGDGGAPEPGRRASRAGDGDGPPRSTRAEILREASIHAKLHHR